MKSSIGFYISSQ